MKVCEHYDKTGEPLVSFEVIPPKRGSSIEGVFQSLDQVMKFKPPFIDITSHAAEAYFEELPDGTIKRHIKRKRPGTIGLCAAIKHRYGIDPVPHIICNGFTKEETEDALIELNYLGIENVLALRGDDHAANKPHNKKRKVNSFAIDLVRQIKRMNKGVYLEELIDAAATNFCIGVAGYPEKHIEAPNLDWDIARLKEKVDAGADYVVTQMFFDAPAYFAFVQKCRDHGITVPIIPGIKVLTTPKHLTSLPKHFYLNIPDTLANAVSSDPQNARNIGIEWAVEQCRTLLEGDVPGLHFYIMADPTPAVEVIEKTGIFKAGKVHPSS